MAQAQVEILGGLTVLARGPICPPEPDVGIFHPYVVDWELFWTTGKGKELPESMYQRVSNADEEAIEHALLTDEF